MVYSTVTELVHAHSKTFKHNFLWCLLSHLLWFITYEKPMTKKFSIYGDSVNYFMMETGKNCLMQKGLH